MEKHSYPHAVVHFDGDSFFAAVEQAKDWRLRGKPVVTGGERGAATSLSIEAKRLGLTRGVPMQDIRRLCPQAIIVAGDYTAYSIYARRMYGIAKTFTSKVEEYSIDECFADITGLEESRGMSYEEIARAIKHKLQESLGITFGVGLAPTKTLAKVASKRNKPDGFTLLPLERIEEVLADTQIYDVWGLGGALSTRLRMQGVITALDYIQKSDAWLSEHGFGKPARDTWLELQGYPVLSATHARTPAHSVMKTRTFTPPSHNRAFIFSQLSKNVEAACVKLRHMRVKSRALTFYLKTQEFTYHSVQMDLPAALDTPPAILACIAKRFNEVYAPGVLYRASGITLRALVYDTVATPDLFGYQETFDTQHDIFHALDSVNQKYGRDTMFLGSSMEAQKAVIPARRKVQRTAFIRTGRDIKKYLDIPFLGTVH